MSDKPMYPGFYYYRHVGAPERHIWVAQVSDTRSAGLHATVYSDLDQHARIHTPVADLKGQWFGPLPSPELMMKERKDK